MILPNKYISISESLIGLSAILLDLLGSDKMTIEELWNILKKEYVNKNKVKKVPNYSKFILALNFMYMSNMINYNENGVIVNENLKLENI